MFSSLIPLRRTAVRAPRFKSRSAVVGVAALSVVAALAGAWARPARAQITQKWASRFSLTTTSSEQAAALAVDSLSGAVIVAGTVETGASSGADYLVVKYDKNGALLWKRQLIHSGNQRAVALAIDGRGYIYVTGTAADGGGYLTAKFDGADGSLAWEDNFTGGIGKPVGIVARGVGYSGSSDVAVAGSDRTADSGFKQEFVAVFYDSNHVPISIKRYSTPGNFEDIPTAITASANGFVVTGTTEAGGPGKNILTVGMAETMWAQIYDGGSGVAGAQDDASVALVTGPKDKYGYAAHVSVAGTTTLSSGKTAWVALRYNIVSGAQIWAVKTDINPAYSETLQAASVDSSGNFFLSGTDQRDGVASPAGDSVAVAKLRNADGGLVWRAAYDGGGAGAAPVAMNCDTQGNAIVVGRVGRGATIGAARSQFLLKLRSENGLQAGLARFTAGVDNGPAALQLLGPSGTLYTTGFLASGGASGSDFATLAYNVPFLTGADIAVGLDNKTRLLWTRSDGAFTVWTVSATGAIENGKSFDSVAGYTPRALTIGTDNKTRVLLDSIAGNKAAIWTLSPNLASVESSFIAARTPPSLYFRYQARDIAMDADNRVRIVWYANDAFGYSAPSQAYFSVWRYGADGSLPVEGFFYVAGPPSAYGDLAFDNSIAVAYSLDPTATIHNGHLLQTSENQGYVYVTTGAASDPLTYIQFFATQVGGSQLFRSLDVGVTADNKTLALFGIYNTSTFGGSATLNRYKVDSPYIRLDASFNYGPYPGVAPVKLSVSPADGRAHLLWNYVDGRIALWTVGADGVILSGHKYGPY